MKLRHLGRQGIGKTMLMERFKRAHPAVYIETERRSVNPVIALQRRFYGHLPTEMGVPFVLRATILDLETRALRSLKRMDVKLLMLDEVRQREGTTHPAEHASLHQ